MTLYFKAESKSLRRQTTFFPASFKKPIKTSTGQNFAILENEQDLTYRVPNQGKTVSRDMARHRPTVAKRYDTRAGSIGNAESKNQVRWLYPR